MIPEGHDQTVACGCENTQVLTFPSKLGDRGLLLWRTPETRMFLSPRVGTARRASTQEHPSRADSFRAVYEEGSSLPMAAGYNGRSSTLEPIGTAKRLPAMQSLMVE